MVMVNIDVPVMGKSYDFQIEENVPLSDIVYQVRDTICLQEQCGIWGDGHDLTLWDAERKVRLSLDRTAGEYGIRTGMHLILV